MSLYDEYQYTQLVKQSTRITSSTQTLIDHLVTTASHRIQSSGVCHLSISHEHCLIYAVRRMIIPRERPTIIETSNYKNFDLNAFAEDLKEIPGDLLNRFHYPNEMWRMWKAFFNTVLNGYAPIRPKRNCDGPSITSDPILEA